MMSVWLDCLTGSKGDKGQVPGESPLIPAALSRADNVASPASQKKRSVHVLYFRYDKLKKKEKEVNKKQKLKLCWAPIFSDLALSWLVHGASVWNDVEGQTGDCGCWVSITSEGAKAPVCYLRSDTPLSLRFTG